MVSGNVAKPPALAAVVFATGVTRHGSVTAELLLIETIVLETPIEPPSDPPVGNIPPHTPPPPPPLKNPSPERRERRAAPFCQSKGCFVRTRQEEGSQVWRPAVPPL